MVIFICAGDIEETPPHQQMSTTDVPTTVVTRDETAGLDQLPHQNSGMNIRSNILIISGKIYSYLLAILIYIEWKYLSLLFSSIYFSSVTIFISIGDWPETLEHQEMTADCPTNDVPMDESAGTDHLLDIEL